MQAGDAPLRHVVTSGGFTPFRRATETLFNLVLRLGPEVADQKARRTSRATREFPGSAKVCSGSRAVKPRVSICSPDYPR